MVSGHHVRSFCLTVVFVLSITTGAISQTTNYIGGSTGDFNSASSWSNGIPTTGYTATISSTATVTANASVTFGSLIITGSGSRVVFNAGATITTVSMSTGYVDFKANLTYNINNFSVTGAATVYISNKGTLNILNSFTWTGTSAVITSSSTTTAGNLSFATTCTTTFNGVNSQYIYYVSIINSGTMNLANSVGIYFYNGATLSNLAGATMNAIGSSTVNLYYSSDASLSLTNWGTLNVNITNGNSFACSLAFYNLGVVNIIAGFFGMNGQYTTPLYNHTGTFNQNSNNPSIKITGGKNIFDTSSVINDGNGIVFNGGTTWMFGNFVPKVFTQAAGITTFYKAFNNANSAITVTGGTLQFAASSTVTTLTINGGTADFQVSSVVSSIILTGSGSYLYVSNAGTQLNVTSSFLWTQTGYYNYIYSNANNNATLNLMSTCNSIFNGTNGYIQYIYYVQLVNYGTVKHSSPAINLYNSASMTNYGTWTASYATSLDLNVQCPSDATLRFMNYGTFAVQLYTTSTMYFYCMFYNFGIINVTTGAFGFAGSSGAPLYNQTGSFYQGSSIYSLKFSGSGKTILDTTSVIYPGNGVYFAAGNTQIKGLFLPTSFTMVGGTTTFLVPYTTTDIIYSTGGSLQFTTGTTSLASLTINGGIKF